jgi:hypothetical protein
MRLRLRSAIALAAIVASCIFFSGYSCQKSGIGTGYLDSVFYQNFHFHQTFNNEVLANSYVDQWDGYNPFTTQFAQSLQVYGTLELPIGVTIPVNTFNTKLTVICPGTTEEQPTIPPVVTFKLKPDYSFSNKLQLALPSCSPTSSSSINEIPPGGYLHLRTEFDGDVPANTEFRVSVAAGT